MLHPQAAAAMKLWSGEPLPGEPGFDHVARRERTREQAASNPQEPVEHVRDFDADGVACRLYRPREHAPLLLGIHGGAFVYGDLDTHDAHWRRVANRTGWAVVAVDYRRAPEHPYPAASDDVDSALRWARAQAAELGVSGDHVAVCGDSAGAQLALVAAMRNPGLTAMGLIYPCIDPLGTQPSYRIETGGLTAIELDWAWGVYLADLDPRGNDELDPLNADPTVLAGLPPTLLVSAEHDPLRDEDELLAGRLAAAGVTVSTTRYVGLIHNFWRWPQLFDAADLSVRQLGAFLDGRIAAAKPHSPAH
jgi:acetyl esterase